MTKQEGSAAADSRTVPDQEGITVMDDSHLPSVADVDECLVVSHTSHIARVRHTLTAQFPALRLLAYSAEGGVAAFALPADVAGSSSAAATPLSQRVTAFIHDNNFLRKVVVQLYLGNGRARGLLMPLLQAAPGPGTCPTAILPPPVSVDCRRVRLSPSPFNHFVTVEF